MTKHLQIKNTLGLALLEGFNKYVKAGLKAFVSFNYCNYQLPVIENDITKMDKETENDISIGGVLSKTQGKTLHFNLEAEAWTVGPNSGNLTVDFTTDLNFPLFGDSVQLAAKAYLHRLNPSYLVRNYHSKHLWWDFDAEKETRTRIEGLFSYTKTNTMLRVAMDNIQNYTYFGMSYDLTETGARQNLTCSPMQSSSNLNVLTAQLHQNFRLGIINWENLITST